MGSPGKKHHRTSIDSVSSGITHAFEAASEAVIASRRASHNEDRSRLSSREPCALSKHFFPCSRSRRSFFPPRRTLVISANRFRLPMDTIQDDADEEGRRDRRALLKLENEKIILEELGVLSHRRAAVGAPAVHWQTRQKEEDIYINKSINDSQISSSSSSSSFSSSSSSSLFSFL